MNTANNKRKQESVTKIKKAFVELLQTKEIKDITVTDICKITNLNRSTFYANFLDVYDLADKVRESLEREFSDEFSVYEDNSENAAYKMFCHIKENQMFYKTYFKLCYESKHLITVVKENRAEKEFVSGNLKYHIEFFRNGLNAIIKMWLENGCKESPEEMAQVLKDEYKGRFN
jgi:AcrR family transcriptional regulator